MIFSFDDWEDSGVLSKDEAFSRDILLDLLNQRFETIDFEQAKQDVLPFITDPDKLDLWSKGSLLRLQKICKRLKINNLLSAI